jgi:decaprenylphospho-beta-D-ribofuranose 2-oxidase
MGKSGAGMLSFPMPGFTLAIDFPRRKKTHDLISRLYEIVVKHEGRVYLAKDACMTPDHLKAMYPRLREFKSVLDRVDPSFVMQSDMSRRLRLSPR